MAKERPDLKKYVGRSSPSSPGCGRARSRAPTRPLPCRCAAGLDLHALHQGGQGSLCRAGDRRRRLPLHGEGGQAEGCGRGEERHQAGARANFKCLMSGAPIAYDHIRGEGKAGRMGARLMAIVAEGDRGGSISHRRRNMEAIALTAQPSGNRKSPCPRIRAVQDAAYGLTTYGDLFTPRQLVALTTFSDLVQEARERVKATPSPPVCPTTASPRKVGAGAAAYADAVGCIWRLRQTLHIGILSTMHAWGSKNRNFSQSRLATSDSDDLGLCRSKSVSAWRWRVLSGGQVVSDHRKALDFLRWSLKWEHFRQTRNPLSKIYAWESGFDRSALLRQHRLRRPLGLLLRLAAPLAETVFPDLFATLAVPKAEELVATPYRHGSKERPRPSSSMA
jgi:putative DNA methylase